MPHRCAFGCKNANTGVVMHVFPNPNKFPERFQAWVTLLGGNLETLSDHEIYKKKRVCDIHFTDEHRNRFKRLNALAIPTLNLPSTSADEPVPTQEPIVTGTITQASTSFSAGTSADVPVSTQKPILIDSNLQTSTALTSDARLKITLHTYSKTKTMQKKIKYLQNEISRLRKKGQSFKERLANASKLSRDISFQRVVQNMTKPAQLFVHMQLQATKKPKGRRFSMEENIMASSLFKKSPKCYKLLCKYFTLPSSRSMRRLLSRVQLSPGINKIIFEKIQSTIHEKDTPDRLCTLIFDEMSISPQVMYNANKDKFEGFACNAGNSFADHVLVFMVKGIKLNYKQPVAYYFTSKLTKFELKNIITDVIKHTLEAGLIIVCTVCDQSPVNVGAITELINDTKSLFIRLNKEWRHDMFRLYKHNIIPLFDTPHLIKGIRNNLITKDLTYIINNQTHVIKWDYFQMVYAADKSYGELRLLDKLTEAHVNPDKINKMKVKSATQLFSHSVAVATEHLTARGDLPSDCRQLIQFTLLIDNLFDSLNVNCLSIPNGKIYKGPVKRNSPHHELWQNAREVLKSAKYIKTVKVGDRIRLTETTAPSLTNLVKTIEGIESLWKILSNKYGLDALLTRHLNQDPIENFFGSIRSYGVRNIAPNSVAFEGAFKALMLNNYNTPHSNSANCEEDTNNCLRSFDFFLKDKVTPDVPQENERIHFNFEMFADLPVENDAGQGDYVCGWVIKKCFKQIIKKCQHCKQILLNNSEKRDNAFIHAKEYQNKNWLCYPSVEVAKYFKEIQNITIRFLKKDVPKSNIKSSLIIFIDILLNDDPFSCPNHKNTLKKYFIETTLNVLICSWCRSVNRILNGKINYHGEDEVKTAAQNYYEKHKNYKNRK